MILFLEQEKIDKQKWDYCINKSINARVYALSWYLDIVSPGWCALVEDDYRKVFPLPVKSKYGIHYIIQPYFTQQLGLFSQDQFDESEILKFVSKIPSKYKFIDICLNSSNQISHSKKIVNARNLLLDLDKNYLQLFTSYKTNLQRNLNKATTNKLEVFKQGRPEELIALFKQNRGATLNHLTEKEYELLNRIAYKALHLGIAEIWSIHDNHNQLCAGALWVKSHGKAIFLFSALSESGKQLNAMAFLIDNYIQVNADQKIVLDFEGSNDEGLARFYSSFGASEETYFRYTDYKANWPINWLLMYYKSKK